MGRNPYFSGDVLRCRDDRPCARSSPTLSVLHPGRLLTEEGGSVHHHPLSNRRGDRPVAVANAAGEHQPPAGDPLQDGIDLWVGPTGLGARSSISTRDTDDDARFQGAGDRSQRPLARPALQLMLEGASNDRAASSSVTTTMS